MNEIALELDRISPPELPPVVPGRAPGDTRVVVAMSGGVDSSVAAALYARAGYDVVGITLQLYDHGAAIQKKGACCAGQDIHDARNVADSLGIPHYVLDYERRFREAVIDDFADTYAAGETPIPCIRCNERVKFRDMLETARELGADALATGHYVRRHEGDVRPELHRAADPDRDQSYFLFTTNAEQLDFLRFPLGHLPKTATRALAASLGLGVSSKPDSQDICFVPEGRYASLVERLKPEASQSGEIVHVDGRVLGQHQGIFRYTIGQRKGLGVSDGGTNADPLYVIRLDREKGQVVVGPRAALGVRRITVSGLNWLGDEALGDAPQRVLARVRSTGELLPGTVVAAPGGAEVALEAPEEGVSPGQACVFYSPDDPLGWGTGSRVLGGGWIRAAD